MIPINPFIPTDCAAVHWQEIKRTSDWLFDSTMPAMLRQLEIFIDPDVLDAHRVRMEDEFHTVSAEALDLSRSAFENAAATRRIEWRRADSANLHPPCQIRIDGGDWINLTFPPPAL